MQKFATQFANTTKSATIKMCAQHILSEHLVLLARLDSWLYLVAIIWAVAGNVICKPSIYLFRTCSVRRSYSRTVSKIIYLAFPHYFHPCYQDIFISMVSCYTMVRCLTTHLCICIGMNRYEYKTKWSQVQPVNHGKLEKNWENSELDS